MSERQRTHVVTGAGSGIGREVAELLRDRGDHLVLPVRNAARVESLRQDFPDADFVIADLSDHDVLPEIASVVPARVDSVVHSAGVVELASVEETGVEGWRRQLDVNLVAPALITAALLPALRAARGTVVFVNSTSGLVGHPSWAAYASSKAALRSLADVLRQEEAAHGVRVTSVFPSRTATSMQERVRAAEGEEYDPSAFIRPETVAKAIVDVLDLGADATVPDLTVRPGPR